MSTASREHPPASVADGVDLYSPRWSEHIATITRGLDEGVLLIDPAGKIRSSNLAARRILGHDSDDLFGREAAALFPLAADGAASPWDELQQRRHVDRLDATVRGADGGPIPVNLTYIELRDEQGERIGASLVLRDRREREKLQRQLLRADRLATIGLLASTVAHEVGTPLNVILGRAEMLEESLSENQGARRQIATIAAQIQRISDVVARLLTFSRETGPGNEPVDLNRVIEEVIALVEPRLRAQKIELDSDLDPDLSELTGNAGHFHQVFVNLVMNAIDVMPDGGRLRLRTRECQGASLAAASCLECRCVQAEVSDTGSGIAEGDLRRIFEPFFTTKKGSKGTGLGLAIADEIVRRYDGQLQVFSTPGEGTRFLLNLPQATHGATVVR